MKWYHEREECLLRKPGESLLFFFILNELCTIRKRSFCTLSSLHLAKLREYFALSKTGLRIICDMNTVYCLQSKYYSDVKMKRFVEKVASLGQ